MLLKFVQCPLFSVFLAIITLSAGQLFHNNSSVKKENARVKAIVELLVVFDMDFSARFENDHGKILQFWAARMWDINMRFKTLPSVDITFGSTDIRSFQYAHQQPFVEQARSSSGLVSYNQLRNNFSQWIFKNEEEENLAKFDVAILVTGADLDYSGRPWSFTESPCEKNIFSKIHHGTLVIPSEGVLGLKCAVVEKVLATLLGASQDENSLDFPCKAADCIMSKHLDCGGFGKYFFSNCSDTEIANFLRSDKASCLLADNAGAFSDVIEIVSKTRTASSFDEQCVRATNNSSAFAEDTDINCLVIKCHVEDQNVTLTLFPVDNSPCGNASFCFRGHCLSRGYSIQNVATELCLHASNSFSQKDTVHTTPCNPTPTPLDQFIIEDKGYDEGLILQTLHSVQDSETSSNKKCLFLNEEKNILQYELCNFSEILQLQAWDFIQVDWNDGYFLLLNRFTQKCASTSSNSVGYGVSVKSCNTNDNAMLWRFYGSPTFPRSWLKELVARGTPSLEEYTTSLLIEQETASTLSSAKTDELFSSTKQAEEFTDEEQRNSDSTPIYAETVSVPPTHEETHGIGFKFNMWAFTLLLYLFSIILFFLIQLMFCCLYQKHRSYGQKPVIYRDQSAVLYVTRL